MTGAQRTRGQVPPEGEVAVKEASLLASQRYRQWLLDERLKFQASRISSKEAQRERVAEMQRKFGDWILAEMWVVGGLDAGHELTKEENDYLELSDEQQRDYVAKFLPPGLASIPRELVAYIAWAKVNWNGSLPHHSRSTVSETQTPFLEAADAVVFTLVDGELCVLVGVRQNGTIALPAGFLDAGEENPYYIAAARELKEEAGVFLLSRDRFTIGELSTTGSALSFTGTIFNDPDRDPRNVRIVSFPSAAVVDYKTIHGQLRPGDDIAAVGLMKVSDLMRLPQDRVWADMRAIVQDSMENYVYPNLKKLDPEHPAVAKIAELLELSGRDAGAVL